MECPVRLGNPWIRSGRLPWQDAQERAAQGKDQAVSKDKDVRTAVAGVTSVDNNLEVALTESNYRDAAKLTTAANNALAANVTVPDSVEAIAEDGNVTLTGIVSYGTERAAAAEAVAGLTGVRNVWNDIEISYDIDPVDVDLHVQEALDRSALVPDGSDVKADTKENVITLTGHVRTWAEHDAVLGAAWMAYGVMDVRDELQVTG
jgi:osmotically-inducible protein OsmY